MSNLVTTGKKWDTEEKKKGIEYRSGPTLIAGPSTRWFIRCTNQFQHQINSHIHYEAVRGLPHWI